MVMTANHSQVLKIYVSHALIGQLLYVREFYIRWQNLKASEKAYENSKYPDLKIFNLQLYRPFEDQRESVCCIYLSYQS